MQWWTVDLIFKHENEYFYTKGRKVMHGAYLWKEAPPDSPVSVHIQPSTTFYWNSLPIPAFPNRCHALSLTCILVLPF
jgi:hypothetical protein